MNIKNKTAIVTGAAQGIGFGIAKVLAQRGCNVVVTDINSELSEKAAEEIRKEGLEAISVVCNVASKVDVENAVSKAMEKYGRVDILVNNAGIFPYVPFKEMTESDWDKVMDVNLRGVFLMTSEVLKVMKEGGRIVSISSIAGSVGFESLVHYCASKGGVNSFTRALALELAPSKITVNAVAPGATKTPGVSMSDEVTEATAKMIPLGRMGVAEDIAGAVAYLCSEEADYVTGQIITVDGGWTLR